MKKILSVHQDSGCRLRASDHIGGYWEPRILHRINRVFAILPCMAFIAVRCGVCLTKALRAASSSHTERVQNLLWKNRPQNEYPTTPDVDFSCDIIRKVCPINPERSRNLLRGSTVRS